MNVKAQKVPTKTKRISATQSNTHLLLPVNHQLAVPNGVARSSCLARMTTGHVNHVHARCIAHAVLLAYTVYTVT